VFALATDGLTRGATPRRQRRCFVHGHSRRDS